MNPRIVAILLGVALLFGIFLPFASAHDDSMIVILTLKESDYRSGEKAGANVHVFDNGARVDPDDPPVLSFMVMDMDYDTEIRNVQTTKVSSETGNYYGEVEIFDSDADLSMAGGFQINDVDSTERGDDFALTYGRNNEDDESFDYVDEYDIDNVYFMFPPTDEGLTIDYSIKNMEECPWMPGEKVEIDFIVREDGKRVKPDNFALTSDSYNYDDDIDVPYNKPGDGKYEAYFSIPPSLKESDTFTISASASRADDYAMVSIDIPISYFCVWYKPISHNETIMDFGLWVSDGEGKAINGLEVGFSSYTWDDMIFINKTIDQGRATFRVENTHSPVDIIGWIFDGEFNQSFSGEINPFTEDNDEPIQNPNTWGFDVISQDDEYNMVGYLATKQFHSFMDREPNANSTIHYYAYTIHDILGFGSAETDSKGGFEIEFDHNPEAAYVNVDFLTPDGYHPGVFHGYGWEDSDGDGFSDKFELYLDTDVTDSDDYPQSYRDSDGDSFGDRYEVHEETDPDDPADFPADWKDSDSDEFGDAFEIDQNTDPLDSDSYPVTYQDSDGDSFGDAYEVSLGTDPDDQDNYPSDFSDSDGDGFGDDFEEHESTDPHNQFSYPSSTPDQDYDGHSDDEEDYYGTDKEDSTDYPGNSYEKNTDGDYTYISWSYVDQHYDGEEEFYGTDPEDENDYPVDTCSLDSDYDGVRDEEEVFHGNDPEDSDDFPFNTFTLNSDGDYIYISWSNYDYQYDAEEEFYGTDPDDDGDYPYDIYLEQSDYDGICDEEERFYGTDPDIGSDSPLYEPSPWDTRYSDHNSTDGIRWVRDSMTLYPPGSTLDRLCDQSVFVEIENFRIGGKNSIRILSDSDLQWAMGNFQMGDMGDPSSGGSSSDSGGWKCFSGDDSFDLYKSDGEYHGVFVIPEFLPGGDQRYTVIGGDAGSYSQSSINYLVLSEGQSGSAGIIDDPEGNDLLLPLIIGCSVAAVIIIIAIVVVLTIMIKRKKKNPSSPITQTPIQQTGSTQAHPPAVQKTPPVQTNAARIQNSVPQQRPPAQPPPGPAATQQKAVQSISIGNQAVPQTQPPVNRTAAPAGAYASAGNQVIQQNIGQPTSQARPSAPVSNPYIETATPTLQPVPPPIPTSTLPPSGAAPQAQPNQPASSNPTPPGSKYGLDDLFQ